MLNVRGSPFPLSAFSISDFGISAFSLGAILKNQFNAPFQDAKSVLLNRRRASTSAMNNRAEATVARDRDRLQKLRYSKIARRYACRSKSLSLTRLSTSAHCGNQTP